MLQPAFQKKNLKLSVELQEIPVYTYIYINSSHYIKFEQLKHFWEILTDKVDYGTQQKIEIDIKWPGKCRCKFYKILEHMEMTR